MKNKNNAIMYGMMALIGGAIIYSIISQNKKRNKLQLDVREDLANLQAELQKTKNNLTTVAIKGSPETQQLITNLQKFGNRF